MFKTINRKQFILLLLIGYVIAYLLVAGAENFRVKNEYEIAKRDYYYKEWLKNGYE